MSVVGLWVVGLSVVGLSVVGLSVVGLGASLAFDARQWDCPDRWFSLHPRPDAVAVVQAGAVRRVAGTDRRPRRPKRLLILRIGD